MAPRRDAPRLHTVRLSSVRSRISWAVLVAGGDPFALAIARRLGRRGVNLCVALHDQEGARENVQREFERLRTLGIQVLVFAAHLVDVAVQHRVLEEMRTAIGKECKIGLVVHSLRFTCREDTASCGDPICRLAVSLVLWAQGLVDRHLLGQDARIIAVGPMRRRGAPSLEARQTARPCALESVSRALALALGEHGVRVNLVVPGTTEAVRRGARECELPTGPLGRLTTATDVANAVSVLSSDDASWINGSIIHVDGGEHVLGAAAKSAASVSEKPMMRPIEADAAGRAPARRE